MIDLLLKFFGAGIGQKIGNAVSNSVSMAALIPAAVWFVSHKDETLTVITYGNAAVMGLLLFSIIKIVHYTAPPQARI